MANTDLTDTDMVKNHWRFRVLVAIDNGRVETISQIQFGVDLNPAASVGSMEAQYAGSSRDEYDFASDEVFSAFGSDDEEPAAFGSDDGISVFIPEPASASDHDSDDPQSPAVFSDVGSLGMPPKISSDDGVIEQPSEGIPYLGYFTIKVRERSEPPRAALFVFSLKLAPNTTFGELLEALTERHFLPFRFRKIGVAYFGCRDFISQAITAWLYDGLLVSREGVKQSITPEESATQAEGDSQVKGGDIFELLGYRYIHPFVTNDRSNNKRKSIQSAPRRICNPIDRAVWPAEFVHTMDPRIMYNETSSASDAS